MLISKENEILRQNTLTIVISQLCVEEQFSHNFYYANIENEWSRYVKS